LDRVTINGWYEERPDSKVSPTATHVVGVLHETPLRKLSRTPDPSSGSGVTDQVPLARVSMSMWPVPPFFNEKK
jgi:hypothetical protein